MNLLKIVCVVDYPLALNRSHEVDPGSSTSMLDETFSKPLSRLHMTITVYGTLNTKSPVTIRTRRVYLIRSNFFK